MPLVPFTRFSLPHGTQSQEWIVVDDATYAAWKVINASAFRMTVEILMTGDVSLAIEDPALGDFDIQLCSNGPDVPVKVAQLINRFNPAEAKAWRASFHQ